MVAPDPGPEIFAYRKPSSALRKKIIKEWQEHFCTASQKWGVCISCGRRYRDVLLPSVPVRSVNFALLQNSDIPDSLLPTTYNVNAYDHAILHPKGLSNRD